MDYTIYAAISEEDKEGWGWLQKPELPPFTPVRIHNPETGRSVCCECRHIDGNFLRKYNAPPRISIPDPSQALVISEWYRDVLGGFETTHNSGRDVKLEVKELRVFGWRQVRRACLHPDAIARIGTRLGVLGVWLGVIGLLPAVLEFLDVAKAAKLQILLGVAAGGAIFV